MSQPVWWLLWLQKKKKKKEIRYFILLNMDIRKEFRCHESFILNSKSSWESHKKWISMHIQNMVYKLFIKTEMNDKETIKFLQKHSTWYATCLFYWVFHWSKNLWNSSWYGLKLCHDISFNVFHILKSYTRYFSV